MKNQITLLKNKTIANYITFLLAIFITFGELYSQQAAPTKSRTDAPIGAVTKTAERTSNYIWTTPVTGMPMIPVWTQGLTYTLKWTGGPTGPVKLYLVNWCTWTTQLVIVSSTPNSHSYSWTVPATLPCGVYECYIQNATGAPTNWSYSMNFAITKP